MFCDRGACGGSPARPPRHRRRDRRARPPLPAGSIESSNIRDRVVTASPEAASIHSAVNPCDTTEAAPAPAMPGTRHGRFHHLGLRPHVPQLVHDPMPRHGPSRSDRTSSASLADNSERPRGHVRYPLHDTPPPVARIQLATPAEPSPDGLGCRIDGSCSRLRTAGHSPCADPVRTRRWTESLGRPCGHRRKPQPSCGFVVPPVRHVQHLHETAPAVNCGFPQQLTSFGGVVVPAAVRSERRADHHQVDCVAGRWPGLHGVRS